MSPVTVQEAQAHLPELIAKLQPGEEVQILDQDRPVARLVAESKPLAQVRRQGSAVGQLVIHEEDEEHLEDFREYMP